MPRSDCPSLFHSRAMLGAVRAAIAPTACGLAMLLAACGGGGDGASPSGAGANQLSGTVAVGAPITSGRLRILDATGAVVVADLPIDADGKYAPVTLTGPAPYRLEACGYAGPNYLCVYSVANEAGTANVTPLTTATVVLSGGKDPASAMSGAATNLGSADVATAQAQLQAAIASLMTSAGISGNFNFVTGPLDAGSREAYDKLLDALGIKIGTDGLPFIQIVPKLGDGNAYLQQGSSSGTITANARAAALDLGGLEALFANMSAAMKSAPACAAEDTGLRRSIATDARLSMEGSSASGRDAVAAAFCQFFAGGEDGNTPFWGSTLLSPTLGRCDFSLAVPVCGVSFVLKDPEGNVMPVGLGMGVVLESGAWKFLGDLLPISIQASARAQRTKRIDTPNLVVEYDRAFAFEVAAIPGLACAKVAQRNADGGAVTLAYYKRHPGAADQARLALWTGDGFSQGPSLDPATGATRSADDTWLALPRGAEGDAVIRNFYRGGRLVVVSLYADAACSSDFSIAGKSSFEVEVDGVPPVWASIEAMPWPEIDVATATAVSSLAIDATATGSLSAAWTFPRGPLGLDGVTVCASRADCGQGGSGRLGEGSLRPGSTSTTVSLRNDGVTVNGNDAKTLALYGRSGEGVALQSNYSVCVGVPAMDGCH